MRSLTFVLAALAPLAPGVLAQDDLAGALDAIPLLGSIVGHYEPSQDWIPEVAQDVERMLKKYYNYTHYRGPSEAWKKQHPHPSPSAAPQAQASPVSCSFWLEDIKHQGIAPFQSNSSYPVFRNVMDYGAKGDGKTDDTQAIQNAITAGNDRCAPGSCPSTSTTPALVYFPYGTYMISSSIIDYYYTMLYGNPNCLPTIKAFSTFSAPPGSIGLIDSDPYNGQPLSYGATNNFWRQVRNLIIDTTAVPASSAVTGIHWPVGQATSIQNVIFNMNSQKNTQHQGIFIESGSGGFMTDLVFNGGLYGGSWGNQQFTMRNMTFNGNTIAINNFWDWGWTYSGLTINNCTIGLQMNSYNSTSGALSVGSNTVFDSSVSNTPIFVKTMYSSNSQPPTANSLILENIQLNNVPIAVQQANGQTALAGTTGQTTIKAWGEGHSYIPKGPNKFQGTFSPISRPSSLLASNGRYYTQSKPQYGQYSSSDFVSARSAGATGNGKTDDTKALQNAINSATSAGKILFLDAGDYKVTSTIFVPAGAKIVGEAFSVILSSGNFFNSMSNPQPVVQIGKPGQSGSVQWSDTIVSTQGQQQGAILFEYNLNAPWGSPSGLWDVHARVGGFTGSNLQVANCPTGKKRLNTKCIAAFMTLHITSSSSGLYMENNWLWTADHDVDDPNQTQITVYNGRGLLDESSGPVWLVGGAVEHHTLYQYQYVKASDVFAGQVQTETPYYQPNPSAPTPWTYNATYSDPQFPTKTIKANGYTIPAADAWGMRIVDSSDILIYGAGFYSFFDNYSTDCSAQGNGEVCQAQIVSIEGSSSNIQVYNENTVGTHYQYTVNGNNVAYYGDNLDGFVDTIAWFHT